MINANELRIGNALLYKGEIIIVKMFSPHTVYYGSDKQQSLNFIDPIPLDPGILEACGGTHSHHRINAFESEERYSLYVAEDEEYAVCFVTDSYGGEENKYIRFRKLHDDILWLHNFKYLHVLQNAIYMYTGTELTVNLEKVKV